MPGAREPVAHGDVHVTQARAIDRDAHEVELRHGHEVRLGVDDQALRVGVAARGRSEDEGQRQGNGLAAPRAGPAPGDDRSDGQPDEQRLRGHPPANQPVHCW